MDASAPFVLLDDARDSGAADAHLYRDAVEVFVAHRPDTVDRVLANAPDAREGFFAVPKVVE